MTTLDHYPLVQGNNAFAFDLYHAIKDGQQNIIFSPYSISQALAMVYLGARGETERQMAETLHFTLPQEKLHPAFSALHERFTETKDDPYHFNTELTIANAIWGQEGYPFREMYLNDLDQYYQADLNLVDFKSAVDESRLTINEWIATATGGRISDMLQPGSITPLTRLMLVNAIYLKAGWLNFFYDELTQEEPFTLLDGREVSVNMMQQGFEETMLYRRDENFQAIRLEYQDERIAMLLVLPDIGEFAEVETAITPDVFRETVTNLRSIEVNLSMPRFETESNLALANSLTDMGMPDAFHASADFSGIADPVVANEPLMISQVVHQANITVDEKGTEAAAATALVFAGGAFAVPDNPIEFKVDRPFLYYIYDTENRAILFMGRVLDPTRR